MRMIASIIIQGQWRGVVGLSSGIPDAYSRCGLAVVTRDAIEGQWVDGRDGGGEG